MDVDGLPIVGASVDLTKVPPIHQKRTLAFLNHFVSHTVHFLNKFASVCETKLEEINVRIQRIETSLSILEAKLSSIPGLDGVTVQAKSVPEKEDRLQANHVASTTGAATEAVLQAGQDHTIQNAANEVEKSAEHTTAQQPTVSQDLRYSKYFKLVQLGVPPMALRPKMEAEGLNPDLLDTPNAPAPFHPSVDQNASDTASDSVSDFSS